MSTNNPGPAVFVQPTAYTVTCLPETATDSHHFQLTVAYRGTGLWAVLHGSQCLGAVGTWDPEPSWSGRDEDWIAAHRFPLPDALRRARHTAPRVTINGTSAADAAHRHSQAPHPDDENEDEDEDEVDNQTRAAWAREILQQYADRYYRPYGGRGVDIDHGAAAEKSLCDVIADGLHLLDHLGFTDRDREATLRHAYGDYLHEYGEEDEDEHDEQDAEPEPASPTPLPHN